MTNEEAVKGKAKAAWDRDFKQWSEDHMNMLLCNNAEFRLHLRHMSECFEDCELFDPRPSLVELRAASKSIWLNQPDAPWRQHMRLLVAFIKKLRLPAQKAGEIAAQREQEAQERARMKYQRENRLGMFSPENEARMAALMGGNTLKMPELGEAY